MSGKFFTWPKIVAIIVVIAVVVGVGWYAASSLAPAPSTSPSPSPTATAAPLPSSSATPALTSNPSSTPSSSVAPTPTVSGATPTPSSTTSATPVPTPVGTATPAPVVSPTPSVPSGTNITFNFDSGTPALTPGRGTPLTQTQSGVTATFSSPQDFVSSPAFSTQNLNSLAALSVVINSTKFSGLFLYPDTINRDQLIINFSAPITSISLTFKTVELNHPLPGDPGSPIRISAYMNSVSNPVGSPVTVNGRETPFDTYPEGTLAFSGSQFNMVQIDLPFVTGGASGFIIDNVIVTTA